MSEPKKEDNEGTLGGPPSRRCYEGVLPREGAGECIEELIGGALIVPRLRKGKERERMRKRIREGEREKGEEKKKTEREMEMGRRKERDEEEGINGGRAWDRGKWRGTGRKTGKWRREREEEAEGEEEEGKGRVTG